MSRILLLIFLQKILDRKIKNLSNRREPAGTAVRREDVLSTVQDFVNYLLMNSAMMKYMILF